MPSSTDIAQLFASQQGQFAQTNYYAQTIGVQVPGMGLGSNQFWGPPTVQRPQVPMPPPGIAPPPPVFSYNMMGPMGPGYGPGNVFAHNVMSGVSGAAMAGGVGLGLATMLAPTSVFGRIGGAIDPVSAFLRAGPAIPFLNPGGTGTVMGGLGAAALPLALGGAAMFAGGQIMAGAQQQQQIGAQLGQFSFLNPMSRTGMGFSRADASDLGGVIRQLAHVPEMLTSVEELTRLLPRMRQMGLMQGVRDMTEFAQRFKDTTKTLRDVAQIMGTTMEEAVPMLAHNRAMGMMTPGQQLGNTLALQYTSAATGTPIGITMGMQASGAGIARQFGGRGKFGAMGVLNIAQKLQAALSSGNIDQETLTDITGISGEGSVESAAQTIYQAQLGLTSTPFGRVAMAGLLRKGANGRYEIDEEAAAQLNRGELTVDDLKRRGQRMGNNAKIAFTGPQGKTLATQLAGIVDIPALIQRTVAHKGPEAGAHVMNQLFGGQLGDPLSRALLGLGKGSLDMSMDEFAVMQGREMDIASRTDPSRIMQSVKVKINAAMKGLLQEFGAKFSNSLGRAYENFIDDLVGRHRVALSKNTFDALTMAAGGGDSSELLRALGGATVSPASMVPSTLGGMFNESSEFAAFNRWRGSGLTTGRTPLGDRVAAMESAGIADGSTFDRWLSLTRTVQPGKRGIAAAGAYNAIMAPIRIGAGDAWNNSARRNELATEGIQRFLFNAMANAGLDVSSSAGIDKWVASQGVSNVVAKLQASTSFTSDTQRAIDLLLAGQEFQQATGVPASITQNIIAGTRRMRGLDASMVSLSSDMLQKFKNVDYASRQIRDAESSLADAFGPTGDSILRNNPTARDIIAAIHSGALSQEDLLSEDRVARASKVVGNVTEQDVDQAVQVLQNIKDPAKARNSLETYRRATSAGDIAAINEKGSRALGQLSGLRVTGGLQGPVEKLTDAARMVANASSGVEAVRAVDAGRAAMTDLARAYAGLSPDQRKTARKELGSALADRLGTLSSVFGLKPGTTVRSVEKLIGQERAARWLPGKSPGEALTAEELSRVQEGLAGEASVPLFVGSHKDRAASQATELSMVEALNAIAKQSTTQTALLTLLAQKADPKGFEEQFGGGRQNAPEKTPVSMGPVLAPTSSTGVGGWVPAAF